MSLARCAFYGSGLALCLTLSSCFGVPSEATKTIVSLRNKAQAGAGSTAPQRVVDLPKVSIDLAKLTPFPGGKGLVVCEPITKSDTATAEFGAGCTRWLHLVVAGQGPLGQTPLWDAVDYARRELKKHDLRFTVDDASALAKKTAVSHVATTTISGNSQRAVLTVQLWQMPEKKAVARPFTIEGSQAELLSALPTVATKLSAAMGIDKPILLPVPDSGGDMQLLGRVPWGGETDLTNNDASRLATLAFKDPLAAVLELATINTRDWSLGNNVTVNMYVPIQALQPYDSYNTLALSQSMWHFSSIMEAQQANIKSLSQKYPHNYLIAASQARWNVKYGFQPGRPMQTAAAQRAVRCAPSNPDAWTALSVAIEDLAQDVRQGRYTSDMSPGEMAYVDSLYEVRYKCTQRAIQIDPQNFKAWHENSKAATFSGRQSDSYASISKAIAIMPNNIKPYAWALEIYQPKWGGDPKKLLEVVKKIESSRLLMTLLHDQVHFALYYSELKAELAKFDRNYDIFMEKEMARDPLDIRPLIAYSDSMFTQMKYERAEELSLEALKRVPTLATQNYYVGWVEQNIKHNEKKAETYYNEVLKYSPNHSVTIDGLAQIAWNVHHDAVKAESLYRKAISIRNEGLYHLHLAALFLDLDRNDEANAEANQAIQLGYTDKTNPIWKRLGIDPEQ